MGKNKKKKEEAEFKPDYEGECSVCGGGPTVDVMKKGELVVSTEMCGVCTWGEAACLDPDNW